MRTPIGSNHDSVDGQISDALSHLEAFHPAAYREVLEQFPEIAEIVMGDHSTWWDTEAMGVDGEFPSWVLDAIQQTWKDGAKVMWEDSEPWCSAYGCLDDWATVVVDQVVSGYVECALWASVGLDYEELDMAGDPTTISLDDVYDVDDVQGEDLDRVREVIMGFLDDAYGDALTVVDDTYTWERVGHDFLLTRDGHGTGFWDRDNSKGPRAEAFQNLTEMARDWGGSEWMGGRGSDGKPLPLQVGG